MAAVPGLYLPPPSPFVSKQSPGTPVNWGDPLASRLVLCWPFNEGSGNCIQEVAHGTNKFNMYFGPNTADGTGVNIPSWTTYDHAPGLNLPGISNNQRLLPSAGSYPPINFKNGITLEFWAKSLIAGTTNVQFAMIQIGTFQAGNVGEIYIGSGQGNVPCYRFSYYGTEVTHTPFTSPANLIFAADHQSLPNHIVATCTPKGEACIYANGQLVASDTTSVTQFVGDELAMFVNISAHTNFQIADFVGVLYKASIYDVALGAGAVAALASNPMRVLLAQEIPGDFVPPGGVEGPPEGGGGGGPDPDPYPGGVPGMPYTDGSVGKNVFIYYKHNWEYLKDPLDVTRHDSYELDFNWPRWKFIRRLWIAGVCSSKVTLQIYVDERLRHTTILDLIPQSGTGWKRIRVLLPSGLKGHMFRFVMTSQAPLKVFLDQSEVEWRELSGIRGYQRTGLAMSGLHER